MDKCTTRLFDPSTKKVQILASVSGSGTMNAKDAIIDLIGGTAGGTACVYVGQPLDTVKVKMQTFPQIYSRGMIHCLMETLKKDGIARGLYAGTLPALAANVSENAVLFAAYGLCQKTVATISSQSVDNMNPFYHGVSGLFAGFFCSFTLCPTELVKCRLQAMREQFTVAEQSSKGGATANQFVRATPWSLCKSIFREQGIRGFFQGLTSTFAREMPGYFVFFGSYELSREILAPPGKTKADIGPLKTILCGGIGGVTLWTAVFPTDVLKSRIQISPVKLTMLQCLSSVLKTEGVRGLYNGLGPTLVRTFPATGALFLAYEYTKKFLNYLTQ